MQQPTADELAVAIIRHVDAARGPDLETALVFGGIGFAALAIEAGYVAWRFYRVKDHGIDSVHVRGWYVVWSIALAVIGLGGILAGISELPMFIRKVGVFAFVLATWALPIVWGLGIAGIIRRTLEREEAFRESRGRIDILFVRATKGAQRFATSGEET